MKKGINKYNDMLNELEGFYSVETLSNKLKVNRQRAIYIIYRLRKLGYVKTIYGQGNKRTYYISRKNKVSGKSYTEKINELSSIQLASWNPHYVYGREISYEEALIYAIKKRDIRYTIASLALFKKIRNWSLLYKLAKEENLISEVAVLYELSRRIIKKVRKMPKRYQNLAKKNISNKYRYIKDGFKSDSFQDLEKKWRVYIPLNISDLEEYRGIHR